jgi:hypothetical protein
MAAESSVTKYEDFVIVVKRMDSSRVGIRVGRSTAGRMAKPVKVAFPVKEGAELRASFVSSSEKAGRMLIKPKEAASIGRRLSHVLFPGPVFQLFAECLGKTVMRPNGGLRIRLDLDASLMDLPWEYTCRPDRAGKGGISDFLLLDPSISLVRQDADPWLKIEPITGRQRLAFVGTLWEGGRDVWDVGKEFDLLRRGLKPVSRYIEPRYSVATQAAAFKPEKVGEAAIFHYAGHCDFDDDGRAYLLREVRQLSAANILYVDDLAPALSSVGTRLTVMSACNSGYWSAVEPLLYAGIPAVIGLNGAVASNSTIEFCAKLYESLAIGLTLDEAVGRARLHLIEWGRQHELFDWGLYMVYMPSPESRLFQRKTTRAVAMRQKSVRLDHDLTIGKALTHAKKLDGMNFGEIMSVLLKRRVLILGRFTARRLKVLEAIKMHLEEHPNRYIPELFTYKKPESRDLVETIIGMAALSRFVIADLSEPKSVQSELEAIVPRFQSVPVVPLINQTGKEYATFSSLQRRDNVVKPTVRYRDIDDLIAKIDDQVVPLAEKTLAEVQFGK